MRARGAMAGTETEQIANAVRRATAPAGPLRTILPFILRYWPQLVLALFFLTLSTLATLAIPASFGNFIQQGFIEKNVASIGNWAWMILAISAVIALASGFRFYFVARLGENILTDLRQAVFAHLLTLDVAFYDAHRVGELTSRLNSDVATIRGVVGTTITITIRALIVIAGALVMMLTISPTLALSVIIGGPLVLLPILFLSRRLRKMSRRAQDAMAELSAMATEMLGANRTVKSFNQEAEQTRRYADRSSASRRAETDRLLGRALLIAGVMMVASLALVGIITLGAHATLTGELTIGQLAQFLIYALMASSSVTSLSEVMGSLQTVAGSTERLAGLLNERPAVRVIPWAVALPEPAIGQLDFDNVRFHYDAADRPAVADLSFSVEAGHTVALVGASGAGKSTIFALIQRFYDISSGSIRLDGIDIRQADPAELRARVAAVEQDPTIFAGTIADNVRFGRVGATDAQVLEAARLALVTEFSDTLPRGLDTIVGERGVRLSGGQRQRLAIARAILKDAPILLLDEATSALDSFNERLVQDALARLRAGRTTLVIAHRLSTIRFADEILVLDQGRIVDRGSHNTLVARSGIYEELVRLQFSDAGSPALLH